MNPAHVYAVKRAISTYAPALFSAIRYGRAWRTAGVTSACNRN